MSYDQIPFDVNEFVDNPEPRCPCLLLLDTSGSMAGRPIDELNNGLRTFAEQLAGDGLAVKRTEVAVMSFGPVRVESEFISAANFRPPTLHADGRTPMGEAIEAGLDLVEQRKTLYRQEGVSYYRPWVFLITDGAPTDQWRNAASRIAEGMERKAFSFFAVGVEEAEMNVLTELSVRQPVRLRGLDFAGMFSWLSSSMSAVSRSRTDEEVALTDPTVGPLGWATI